MSVTTEQYLVIVVGNGRWDAFGDPSPANQFLLELLQQMGGVSESVADGTYHFSAEVLEGETFAVHLEPAP